MNEQKKIYQIRVAGCDDETEILKELSISEVIFLEQLSSELNKESKYSCQPRFYIQEPNDNENE